MSASEHVYRSTACTHLIHDECRRECKFCEARCSCPCHADECHYCLRERARHDGTGECPTFQAAPLYPDSVKWRTS